MKIMQEGQPPAWSTYVSVDDAEATAAAVTKNGGGVMVEPMDVMDLGRMAFFTDPAGAFFGVWQPKAFDGADVVNVPELALLERGRHHRSRGCEGLLLRRLRLGPGRAWTSEGSELHRVELDGQPVGGLTRIGDQVPPGVPSHWSVCFAVADADAITARAQELGGSVTRARWTRRSGASRC